MNQDQKIQTQLQQLKQKLYDLSARNPLVNAKQNKLWFVDSDDNNAAKIYKKQQFFKKEYGLQTTLLVTHFIRWKSLKKDTFYTSPLIYQAIQIVKNQKISLQFNVDILDESFHINPIIKDELFKKFNIDLNLENGNIDTFLTDLKQNLENNQDDVEVCNAWNENDTWQIVTLNAIGNFNYKKSILGQDYNHIISQPNASVSSLLGFDSVSPRDDNSKLILPQSDDAQQNAIKKALQQNCVIQGPPGTGKSHTIVELLKQNLLLGKKILFVSEKKSALDVVFDKLKQDNLSHLVAYFNAEKNQKKTFYAHLKQSVDKRINVKEFDHSLDLKIEELTQYFETYSKQLTQPTNQNTSIYELLTYLAKHQVNDLEYNVQHKIPTYADWQKYLEFIQDVEHIAQAKFDVKTIAQLPFIQFNKSVFVEDNPLPKIEKRLNELQLWLNNVKTTLANYNLNWSWVELNKYCLSASILNLANTSQLAVLDPSSKQYKSFDNWTKKYELTQNKLKLSNELCAKWEVKPKLADIDALINELEQSSNKKWWRKFKTSKVDTVFKKYEGDLSIALKIDALKNLKNNYLLQSNIEELKIKLKHNLNILNPDVEIDYILQLRQKLDALSHNEYVFLLEYPNSLKLIKDLHDLHAHIQKSNQIVKFLFTNFDITNLTSALKQIESIKKQTPKFKFVLPEIKKLLNLTHIVLSFIKHNAYSVEQLTHIVVYHNYLELVRFQPILKNFDVIDFLPNFKHLQRLKLEKSQQIIAQINQNWSKQKQDIEKLLSTPASKLKGNDKTKKQALKQAKRVIYHEIAKQQQHLPIKSLVEQTQYSIFEWQPLWLMNPLSIGENLPCNPDLFDVIIFDESSQIPLEDALPAVYRSKQIVVVGDSKQMPPSQFFSGSSESTTLLNQADSVFKSQLLSWHYRSEHPRLMSFSNSNFYDNELCYFPAINAQNPIELIVLKDGLFVDGQNEKEAQKIAELYQTQLKNGVKNVGIIAFSKGQEQLIEKEILKLKLPQNDDLLIRNLENTQGIERDLIIISVGYGFNTDGNFNMNFGPINQDFGANRLNVLLTRAKQKMIVVTSVTSADFKLSDNRGVQLLRDFLWFAENEHQNQNQQQPNFFLNQIIAERLKDKNVTYYSAKNGLAVHCFVQHSTQKILLIDPTLQPNDNSDIYTILSVLNTRFSAIKTTFTQTYWQNKSRFLNEVETFFGK